MKYLAIIDEAFLSNFRLDDGGLTLVVKDKNNSKRAMPLKPIGKPVITLPTGDSVYITQGHIDAMLEYEKQEQIKEVIEQMQQNWDCKNEQNNL